MNIYILILFSAFASTLAQAQISLQGLPPSRSAQESVSNRDLVRARFFDYFASIPLSTPPIPPKVNMENFLPSMLGRIAKRQDLEAVSRNLLTPDFHPWNTGTEIALLGSICKRMGDYDFVLQGLIKMAYLDEEAGRTLLTPAARNKLRHELLSETGNKHHIKFTLDNCVKIKIRDSENHILMIEISRYLTNQLLLEESRENGQENVAYDNEKNGFNAWLMNHLSQFLRTDFDEVNSRPYQGFTLIALANLYSYARDPKIKLTAQMILDYLSAKSAIQSNGLRRYMPFRRQKEWRDTDDLLQYDNTMYWYTFHAGNYKYLELIDNNATKLDFVGYAYMPLMAALDKYEVPELILELFTHRDRPIFDRIKSKDVEIYFSSPNFLLSSGGRHRSVFGFFTGQNDSWAVSTTVIPNNYGLHRHQLFSIAGNPDWNKKNNTCVAPNFACGENFLAPTDLPVSCATKVGAWTFFDTVHCPLQTNFYLAAYSLPTKKATYAFFEVREGNISFEEFKSLVLARNANGSFSPGGLNTYVTSDNKSVEFTFSPKDKNTYPISKYNGTTVNTDTNTWPLGSGSTINSSGDGLIRVENESTRTRLILDGRDSQNPKRYIEAM